MMKSSLLFHEFGHGLHHLLTRVEHLGVSGINGVEWDAVELPSQFMENFCWEWNVLEPMTAHIETGAHLPNRYSTKCLPRKTFRAACSQSPDRDSRCSICTCIMISSPDAGKSVKDLLDDVRRQVAVIIPRRRSIDFRRAFHIFRRAVCGGLLQLQMG
jgi:oligopeptidase A